MRFREVVFVHNVVNDDRFCNTPSIKSVISLPIIQAGDLLGVLYLVCSFLILERWPTLFGGFLQHSVSLQSNTYTITPKCPGVC